MPNSLPGRIAALVLATLALPGCGGGTDPATEPNLRTITIDVGNDGESDGINIELSAPLLMVGDDNLATVKRALLIFPLDNIPAGATVSSAALNPLVRRQERQPRDEPRAAPLRPLPGR